MHRLAFQWVKPKKGEKEVRTSKFYVDWCGFCGKWLCQLTEDFEQHVAMHEQLVGQLIEQDGYAGVEMGDKMIQPAINPFSGHDTSMTYWDRFKTHFDSKDMFEAITKIIDSMEENDRRRCPASFEAGQYIKATCKEQTELAKEELLVHMEKEHGILEYRRRPQKRKGKTKAMTLSMPPMKKRHSKMDHS